MKTNPIRHVVLFYKSHINLNRMDTIHVWAISCLTSSILNYDYVVSWGLHFSPPSVSGSLYTRSRLTFDKQSAWLPLQLPHRLLVWQNTTFTRYLWPNWYLSRRLPLLVLMYFDQSHYQNWVLFFQTKTMEMAIYRVFVHVTNFLSRNLVWLLEMSIQSTLVMLPLIVRALSVAWGQWGNDFRYVCTYHAH